MKVYLNKSIIRFIKISKDTLNILVKEKWLLFIIWEVRNISSSKIKAFENILVWFVIFLWSIVNYSTTCIHKSTHPNGSTNKNNHDNRKFLNLSLCPAFILYSFTYNLSKFQELVKTCKYSFKLAQSFTFWNKEKRT